MAVSLFSSINYARPTSYTETAIFLLSKYFYLDGVRATVVKGELWLENEKLEWLTIAFKIAYFIALLPLTLVLLVINISLRYRHSLTVNIASLYKTDSTMSVEHCSILGFGNSKPIMIMVYKQDLQNRPFYHLERLCQAIKANAQRLQDPRMMVSYLKGEPSTVFTGNLLEGSDTGGISRDYLYVLTKAIAIEMPQFFVGTPLLRLPYVDHLSPQMEQFFKNMGILMMYCYRSERQVQTPTETLFISRLIGQYFDPALFNATLCLTAEEIDVAELSLTSKIKMCRALVQSRVDAGEDLNWLFKVLTDMTVILPELNDAEDINQFVESLGIDKADLSPQKNREKLIEEAIYLCMQNATNMKVEGMLKPMHAIAKGMKEICYPGLNWSLNVINIQWNHTYNNIPYQTFSDKVQGSRLIPEFRQLIINNIIYEGDNDKIIADVRRIREWIIDPETSEEDVRMFLKFTTGATTLLEGQTIRVLAHELYPSVVPIASTCAFTLTFSTRYPQDVIEQQRLQSEEEKSKTVISYFKQEMTRVLDQFDRS